MIEEKVKADLTIPDNQIVKLGDQEIQVEPFLRYNDQELIIGVYLKELFAEEKGNHNLAILNAENALIASILHLSTNLMTMNEKNEPIISHDILYANWGFVKEVLSKIENYREFRDRLNATVEFTNEQRRLQFSVGSKVDLVVSKIINFIDDISDMTPEKLEEMKNAVKEITGSEILGEAISIFKNRVKSN